MRAVVIPRAGSYDQLQIQELPDLQPKDDEVLIAVRCIGINYADCIVRMGLYQSAKDYVGWPITPGFEVAGVVEAVGAAITDLEPGQQVFAVTRFAGYATQVLAPRHQVFSIPEGWTLAQAAGFPAVALTASYAVFELCRPRKGQRALVHSAAGGVGGALCQLLSTSGVEVTGVVGSTHKLEAARDAGATHIIDKSRDALWSRAESIAAGGFEMIFDANGVETLGDSYKHLAPQGRLVVYGFHTMMPRTGGRPNWLKLAWNWLRTPSFNPLDMTTRNKSVLAFNLSYLFENTSLLTEHMEHLAELIAKGQLKAPPVTCLPFEQVAEAHRRLESGQTIGKLVLTLDPA